MILAGLIRFLAIWAYSGQDARLRVSWRMPLHTSPIQPPLCAPHPLAMAKRAAVALALAVTCAQCLAFDATAFTMTGTADDHSATIACETCEDGVFYMKVRICAQGAECSSDGTQAAVEAYCEGV